MIFPYSFIDIVIKRSALEKIEKELSNSLIIEYQVQAGHYDNDLIIIKGGMSLDETVQEIKNLERKYHLVHICDGVAQDMVCVKYGEICSPCPWLKSGILSEDIKIGNSVYKKRFPYFEYQK